MTITATAGRSSMLMFRSQTALSGQMMTGGLRRGDAAAGVRDGGGQTSIGIGAHLRTAQTCFMAFSMFVVMPTYRTSSSSSSGASSNPGGKGSISGMSILSTATKLRLAECSSLSGAFKLRSYKAIPWNRKTRQLRTAQEFLLPSAPFDYNVGDSFTSGE